MQGAQLHGFRLVRRDGQVTVECLLCQKQGFDAQSGRHFLKNYLNWHQSLSMPVCHLVISRFSFGNQ